MILHAKKQKMQATIKRDKKRTNEPKNDFLTKTLIKQELRSQFDSTEKFKFHFKIV